MAKLCKYIDGLLPTGINKRQYYLLFIPVIAVFAVSLLVFYYYDMTDTLDNSVMLVESIFKGEFHNYYEYAARHAHPLTIYTANYNVLVYAIFAVWNLPVVIIHALTGFDYMTSALAILWCKGLILLSVLAVAVAVYKLCMFISEEKTCAFDAAFLFASSAGTLLSAFVANQYDSISLAIMLWALVMLSQDKAFLSLLLFSIAVPLKFFAIFALIPVALIYLKSIWKTAVCLLASFVPNVLVNLLFVNDECYHLAIETQNRDAVQLLIDSVNIGGIRVFFVCFIAVCVYCLLVNAETKKEKLRVSIYSIFLIFASFVTTVPIRSYWLILYVPFMCIVLCSFAADEDNRSALLHVLSFGAGITGCIYFLGKHWIYSLREMYLLLLLRFIKVPSGYEYKYHTINNMIHETGFSRYEPIVFTVFFACLLCVAVLCRPSRTKNEKTAQGKGTIPYLWMNASGLCVVLAIILFAALKVQPTICAENALGFDCDAPNYVQIDETGFSQPVNFCSDRRLSSLELSIASNNSERHSRSLLYLEMIDDQGNCLWENDIGIAKLEAGIESFDMDGICVEQGRTYLLNVSARDLRDDTYGSNVNVNINSDSNGELLFRFR